MNDLAHCDAVCQAIEDAVMPDGRLRGVIATLPRCCLEPGELAIRLRTALVEYRIESHSAPYLPIASEQRRHGKRIIATTEKLRKLLRAGLGSLVEEANVIELSAVCERLEADMATLTESGRAALSRARAEPDPLLVLVRSLVAIWAEATGERPRQPTYDSARDEVSGWLIDFIVTATGEVLTIVNATGEVLTIRPGTHVPIVSTEAIRYRLRALLPGGVRSQKISMSRPWTTTDEVRSSTVTPANEVTHDEDSNG